MEELEYEFEITEYETEESNVNAAEDIPVEIPEDTNESLDESASVAEDEFELDEDTDEAVEEDDTSPDEETDKMIEEDDGTDWEGTSLTPDQEEIIRSMENDENEGDIYLPVKVKEEWTEPEKATEHLPSDAKGEFLGERGNSGFIPNDAEALAKMKEYGMDHVDYRGNEVDFSPCSIHDTPNGKLDSNVKIGHMTDNRTNGKYEFGRRPKGTSHDPNYDIGNFAQADNALFEQFQKLNPGSTMDDLVQWRKDNHLIWHELSDGESMQLVPEAIHKACAHSGGVSEMQYRMAYGDITLPTDGCPGGALSHTCCAAYPAVMNRLFERTNLVKEFLPNDRRLRNRFRFRL